MTDEIAIAHKDYSTWGGGERVAEELCRTFDAPMYTGIVDREPSDNVNAHDLSKTNRVLRWGIDRGGLTRQLAYMGLWQRADDLRQYDTVITSGNEPLWYTPEEDQTLVAYCHHTLRMQHDRVGEANSWVEVAYGTAVRTLFDPNIRMPDLLVANSELIARRLKHYFGVDEERIRVVYPPVPTREFGDDLAEDGDYYAACSRLVDHKRFDEVVEAFNKLDQRLILCGDGDEYDRLAEMAGENVALRGYVSEQRKREILAGAKGYLFNATQEDFGIAPVEALASGTPLLTVDEGFPAEMVVDGKNGYTFERGVEHIRDTVSEFEESGVDWSGARIERFADRFSVPRFHDEMREVVAEAQEQTTIEVPWGDDEQLEQPTDTTPVPTRTDGGEP